MMEKKLMNEFDLVQKNAKRLIVETKKDLENISSGEDEYKKLIAAGRICERSLNLSKAEYFFDKALSLKRNDTMACIRQAIVKLKSGQEEKGLMLITDIIKNSPEMIFNSLSGLQCSAMSVYGDALYLNGNKNEAKSAYRKAMKIEGKGSWATGRYVELLLEENEIQKALELKNDLPDNETFNGLQSYLKLIEAGNEIGLPGIEAALQYHHEMPAII